VAHYRIEGGGHSWPGSTVEVPNLGVTTHTIQATTLIWQFFVAHPL
jgi:polyhydroxybutyrate depolymerase